MLVRLYVHTECCRTAGSHNLCSGSGWHRDTSFLLSSRCLGLLTVVATILIVALIMNHSSTTNYQLGFRPSRTLPPYKTKSNESQTPPQTTPRSQCDATLANLLLQPGIGELDQFYRSLNISRTAFDGVMRDYREKGLERIFDVGVFVENNCATLLISERLLQRYTTVAGIPAGGAGFHTVALGQTTVTYCPYMDLYNGSYAVLCPLYEQCVNVTSHLLHIDYVAYAPNIRHSPLNRLIIAKQVCSTNRKGTEFRYPKRMDVYWERRQDDNSTFPWQLRTHNMDTVTDTSKLAWCVQRPNTTFYLIGDSHVRNIAYYMSRLNNVSLQNITQKSQVNFKLGNVVFFFTKYITFNVVKKTRRLLSEMQQQLQKNRSDGRSKSELTVVMDVGTWDLTGRNLSYFATTALPAFRAGITDMRDRGLLDGIRVVLFNIPPLPLWTDVARKRNPMDTAVGNLLLEQVVQHFNFTLVNYFGAVRPLINESAPSDHHYLKVNNTGIYGHVGTAIANYILRLLCDNRPINLQLE